jgi:hypothetical protein
VTPLPLKDLSVIDPSKVLLDGDAFTIDGQFTAADWSNCGEAAEYYVHTNDYPLGSFKSASVEWHLRPCNDKEEAGDAVVRNFVYVAKTPQIASRVVVQYQDRFQEGSDAGTFVGGKADTHEEQFQGANVWVSRLSLGSIEVVGMTIRIQNVAVWVHLTGSQFHHMSDTELINIRSIVLSRIQIAREQ